MTSDKCANRVQRGDQTCLKPHSPVVAMLGDLESGSWWLLDCGCLPLLTATSTNPALTAPSPPLRKAFIS